MKAKFNKGQKIYRVIFNVNCKAEKGRSFTTVGILEDIVDGCGQKRLTLVEDNVLCAKQFDPNQKGGWIDDQIDIFHSSLESAEKELISWVDRNNGRVERGFTYYYTYQKTL